MRRYTIQVKGQEYTIDVEEETADRFKVWLGDETFEVYLTGEEDLSEATITPEIAPAKTTTPTPRPRPVAAPSPSQPAVPRAPAPTMIGNSDTVTAPMPGTILSVAVSPGDQVTYGQVLLVLEAMKMKNAIKSPREGVIAAVPVQAGQTVAYGDLLIRFERG